MSVKTASAGSYATILLVSVTYTLADSNTLLQNIKAFFETNNDDQREQIARRIAENEDYNYTNISYLLHQVDLFKPLNADVLNLRVELENGEARNLNVRVPADYNPRRAYPLIYALHGQGGNGLDIIRYIERMLPDRVDQYVLAAPDDYQQVLIHSTIPPSAEHLLCLLRIKQAVHIDSNRVYAIGYSRGGHAAWALAVAHPHEFAGVAAVAGCLLLQDYGELAELFLPNLAATRIYACWGEKDIYGPDGHTLSPDGGIAGVNRRVCEIAASQEAPLKWYEVPETGHGGVSPPRAELEELLSHVRPAPSKSVRHVFRLLYQGRAAWLEARDWQGPWWDQKPVNISFSADENPDDPADLRTARARAVRNLLGEVRGEIKDQEIRVYRKRIDELAIWIADDMIDWDRPITLTVNGRKVFEGSIQPDVYVCLSQAARSYDFDRLYWAGLYFKSSSKVRVITGRTPLPPVPLTP